MAEKTILVCDTCGGPDAESVMFRTAEGNRVKDFCSQHYADLLNGSRKPTRGRKPGSVNRKPTVRKIATVRRRVSRKRKAA